jgi:hypothetical protein
VILVVSVFVVAAGGFLTATFPPEELDFCSKFKKSERKLACKLVADDLMLTKRINPLMAEIADLLTVGVLRTRVEGLRGEEEDSYGGSNLESSTASVVGSAFFGIMETSALAAEASALAALVLVREETSVKSLAIVVSVLRPLLPGRF